MRLLLLILTGLLAGCVSVRDMGAPPVRGPVGPVFLVHGIYPGTEDLWVDDLEVELERRGVEAIPVAYRTFVTGYLFGYGTAPPAEHLARFVELQTDYHPRTDCEAPLDYQGVGYSAGTRVLLEAANLGVRFERLVYAGSPVPAWDSELAGHLASGQVGALVNYYSALDGITFLLGGAGSFGFRGAEGEAESRVDNRSHWRHHFLPLYWDDDQLRELADELAVEHAGPLHTCYDQAWYRTWYQAAKRSLLDRELPEPWPSPPPLTPGPSSDS
jgi:hypothetical protein